ncbi:pantoate--beta-alanine ligase [Nonlabens mediterrranea]|uniref:Pantothenate synthetase n=1 Tax=Nonlabens mediterrranea TaxID=1419947 RepID=A0ABS0A312_9FLAO|nr:pantoate--beta-alanine ligase [Nonlabens mediterrranea]
MVFQTHKNLSTHIESLKNENLKIGFVPTMGALHAGHISLMKEAAKSNDILVVSIFVNPTQFENANDLNKYPRTVENDTRLIYEHFGETQVVIYTPNVKDIYGDNAVAKSYRYDGLEHVMEGANRPGHFDGVGTILEFLFLKTQPDYAYFGEKDFQQLQIVKKLVEKLQLPIKIIGCPIKRESHGLAMSSRNERLSPNARKEAAFIIESLGKAKAYFNNHSINQTISMVQNLYHENQNLELEYFTIASEETLVPVKRKYRKHTYRAFIVAHIEGVRLIDNMRLSQ